MYFHYLPVYDRLSMSGPPPIHTLGIPGDPVPGGWGLGLGVRGLQEPGFETHVMLSSCVKKHEAHGVTVVHSCLAKLTRLLQACSASGSAH